MTRINPTERVKMPDNTPWGASVSSYGSSEPSGSSHLGPFGGPNIENGTREASGRDEIDQRTRKICFCDITGFVQQTHQE